eukprot:jgi/Orpsp1_1/1178954/evm.model.c7180000067363.1
MDKNLKGIEDENSIYNDSNFVNLSEEELSDVDSDKNDLKSTIIYFIISCSEDYCFRRKYLEIITDNIIKKKIKKIKKSHRIQDRKIYLFKIKFYLKEDESKVTFYIKLNYLDKSLITESPFTVNKFQQLYIYNEKYKYEHWYIVKEKRIDDFVNNKYKLSNLQKFLVFKNFLPFNQLPFLLLDTAEIINKTKVFDFEFGLVYLMSLTEKQNSFSELSWGLKDMFRSIFLNLKNKKKIIIRKYNNIEYRKVINIIENYDIGVGDKEFLLYYYLFILLYHQYHGSNNFNEFFKKMPLKTQAFKFIAKHKGNFSKLKASNLQFIFERVNKNKVSFDDILSISSDYNESLKFICMNKDYIFSEQSKSIKFNEFPPPDEHIDIKVFIQYIEILRELQVDKNELLKQFSQLIQKLNMKSYKKLISLREITENYKDISFSTRIIRDLRVAIHNTGKYFIENDKLDPIDIIKYIQEDGKLFSKDYENKEDFALLIGHIDMDRLDDAFLNIFIGNHFDYEDLFKNNYEKFLDSLTQCAKTFVHLYMLTVLFNIYNQPYPGHMIIAELIETLMNNTLDRKELTITQLSQIIGSLFKLVSDNENIYLNELIEATNLNFSENEVDIIFIYILNQYGKEFNQYAIDELVKTIKNISNDDVIAYLNQFENKEIKASFLKKINDRVVKEDEIISEDVSDNLKLLIQLFYMGYFNESEDLYKDIRYINDTRLTLYQLIEKLGTFNFSMEYLTIMYRLNNVKINEDGTMLKHRCFIMTLGNSFIMDELYSILMDKIDACLDTFGKVEEIIQIFSFYFAEEWDNIIQYYRSVREKMIELPINKFPDPNQIKYFDKFYTEAHEINKMKDSKFFLEIYQKNKYEEEMNEFKSNEVGVAVQKENVNKNRNSTLFFKTKEKFLNLKNLFNINTEKLVDLVLLEEVISHMGQEEMIKEINFVMEIFDIHKLPSINQIYKKLNLLKERRKNIDFLRKVILLFKDFHIKYNRIQKRFENAIELLENSPSLSQLFRVDSILKRLNLNILNSSSSVNANAQAVIHKMYNKPELMKFILDKTINDIHQMGEFIDESEDVFIVLSDIDQLESCMSFIQELRRMCPRESEDEVKFLNTFIDLTNSSNFKDIGINFENSSGKYNDFYDLYTYHLNSNELNKVHIKKIYQSSKFNIELLYPEYKCSVSYMNSKKLITKEFDEVLDLRDIALLRKKDQRKGEKIKNKEVKVKEEEDDNYIRICDVFARIVTDIQEILILLDSVTSKGYYKEINYRIVIVNGQAYGYSYDNNSLLVSHGNSKSLKEIIKELHDIKKMQDENVQFIYLSDSITRMIYGRQFYYIYRKIFSNKINENSSSSLKLIIDNVFKNILKYITNNFNLNEQIEVIRNQEEDSPLIQMYHDVSNYLNELFRINFIDLKEIYKSAHLLDETKKGICSYVCPLKDIEKNAINCSFSLTGNFPIAQTVLYCNSGITEEEIISFVYKSILCRESVLFILIKPENLRIERKNLLIDLLKKLYSTHPRRMKSSLLFIYSEENRMKEIITEIEKLPYHKYFDFKIDDNTNENNKNKNK